MGAGIAGTIVRALGSIKILGSLPRDSRVSLFWKIIWVGGLLSLGALLVYVSFAMFLLLMGSGVSII